MNLSPPALAHGLPLSALLLILWTCRGFFLHSSVRQLDVVYAVLILLFGMTCAFRTHAPRNLRVWRFLLGAGIAALLATSLVRMVEVFRPELAIAMVMLVGFVGATGTTFGAYALLGSALALREDPTNRIYRALSLGGATLALCSMVISTLSEAWQWFPLRVPISNVITVSTSTVFLVVIRGGLLFSCIVGFGRAVTEAGIRRKQSLLLKGMLVFLVFVVLYGVLAAAGSFLPNVREYREDLRRLTWLNGISLCLLLINPVLLSLAFRQSEAGYKSSSSGHSQGGAET